MTLKVRLAVMMIVLLAAVMALQVLLTQREQRVLVERLGAITGEIESTTRRLSRSTLEIAAEADSAAAGAAAAAAKAAKAAEAAGAVPRMVRVPFGADSSDVRMMVFVREDSSTVDGHETRRIEHTITTEGLVPASIQAFLERHAELRELPAEVLALCAEADSCDTSGTATWIIRRSSEPDSSVQLVFRGREGGPVDEARIDTAFRVHLPVPGADGGPGGKVELLYPAGELTEELARVRRRSWWWLAGLLGVGASGAVALAVQFTRPIRSLESSFALVEGGNLDVAVAPERHDEVGRLTESFNEMVAKLREKKSMEARLTEAERLAAVGQLAAGVAHEVRNPLNAMRLTMAQLGEKTAPAPGTPEREQFDRYVHLVTAELARLERLVGTFLDLSRRDDGAARETVLLPSALRDGLALLAAEAKEKGVTLTVEVPDRLALRGDPARLPVVWSNLVTNALNATASGGTVRVAAFDDGDAVRLEVTDDGAGIPPEVLPRIWEPFFSTRRDGSGLGLSLVRAIVEQHGGTVAAESEVDGGTTIRVTLPKDGGGGEAA